MNCQSPTFLGGLTMRRQCIPGRFSPLIAAWDQGLPGYTLYALTYVETLGPVNIGNYTSLRYFHSVYYIK